MTPIRRRTHPARASVTARSVCMALGATCASWAVAQPDTATGDLNCSATSSGRPGYTQALQLRFAGHVANGVHETDRHHEIQELVVDPDGRLRFSAAGVGKLDDSRWFIRASGLLAGRSISLTGKMYDGARRVIRETCTVSLRASHDVRPPGSGVRPSLQLEQVGAPLEFSASTLWGQRAFREWNFEYGMPWSFRESPSWGARPLGERPLRETERALGSELRALVAELPIKALVLVDGGQVAAAWSRPGITASTLLPSASMSKSVTALAVGQAVCTGHLSLETRAADLMPALRGKATGAASLRQLLLMSSGSAETQTQHTSGVTFREAEHFLQAEANSLEDLISDSRLAGAKPAGQVFDYKSYDPYLAALMVQQATGRRFTSWVRDTLFRQAGMEHEFVLDTDRHGNFLATGGVRLSLSDWVRLGVYIQELRDRNGCLGDFVRDMLRPVITLAKMPGVNGHFNGYGYFTWANADLAPEMGWIAGHFGQRIGISSRAGNPRIFLTFGDGTDPSMRHLYPLARRWVH
jgi:CubicO group peptidase (beta-lactamase class C family)